MLKAYTDLKVCLQHLSVGVTGRAWPHARVMWNLFACQMCVSSHATDLCLLLYSARRLLGRLLNLLLGLLSPAPAPSVPLLTR